MAMKVFGKGFDFLGFDHVMATFERLEDGPIPARKNGLPDGGGKRSIDFWTCLGGKNDGTRIPSKKLRLVWAVIYV